jgi:deoxycytidine triphosphate deaminase
MYLLNNIQIETHATKSDFNYLGIEHFEKNNLQHTSYYFRLGYNYSIFDEDGNTQIGVIPKENPILVIKPDDYIIVESIEIFSLSNKVKGTIGSLSEMIYKGLQINYSPFIDPLYNGWLSVGIKNLLKKDIILKYGENIGKVSFYDISDTYPIKIVKGSHQDNLFNDRATKDQPTYPEEEDDSELYAKKEWNK